MKPKPLDLDIEAETKEFEKDVENCPDCPRTRYGDLTDFCRKHLRQHSIIVGKEMALREIKSACEFYLKYFSRPAELLKDFPELRQHRRLQRWTYESKWKPHAEMDDYNKWFFKLAFKGVMEEKNG